MAEIFVCLWDKHWVSNAEHGNNNWREGMVVTIKDDGSPWGRAEDPRVWTGEGNNIGDWQPLGLFAMILAPGVAADYPQAMIPEMRPSLFSEPEFLAPDEADKRRKITRRKRWKVDLTDAQRTTLATTGIDTFTPIWRRLW